jgi:hypothetical protein
VLKVGTCQYTGEMFSPEKQGFENGLFFPFLVIFCGHSFKCPSIFLCLATVAASVITDFKIFIKICVLLGRMSIFENWFPRR